jgi:hypothetical protein
MTDDLPGVHVKAKLVVSFDDADEAVAQAPAPAPAPLPSLAPGPATPSDIAVRVLAAAAVAVVVAALLPWYRADGFGSVTASGWEALRIGGRVILAASILLVLACAADLRGGLGGHDPVERRDLGHVAAVVGGVAAAYVLVRLMVAPTFFEVRSTQFGVDTGADASAAQDVEIKTLSGGILALMGLSVIAIAGGALARMGPGGFDLQHAWTLITRRDR